jgi:hypothetical protein
MNVFTRCARPEAAPARRGGRRPVSASGARAAASSASAV